MAKHVAVLGLIHLILGALGALTGLAVMVFGLGGGLATWIGGGEGSGAAGGFIALLGSSIGVVVALSGLFGVFTGLGLMARRGWGRILGIISSALNLLNFPWLTLLGIYGLWVLLSEKGAREFKTAR